MCQSILHSVFILAALLMTICGVDYTGKDYKKEKENRENLERNLESIKRAESLQRSLLASVSVDNEGNQWARADLGSYLERDQAWGACDSIDFDQPSREQLETRISAEEIEENYFPTIDQDEDKVMSDKQATYLVCLKAKDTE